MKVRVLGLKAALSAKFTQNFLYIVDSLAVPTPDPQFLSDLVKARNWGGSVLLVQRDEEIPENLLKATENLKTISVIPALGLNVHSILKHESLVLTLDSVQFLEEKLLWHDTRFSPLYPFSLPYSDK